MRMQMETAGYATLITINLIIAALESLKMPTQDTPVTTFIVIQAIKRVEVAASKKIKFLSMPTRMQDPGHVELITTNLITAVVKCLKMPTLAIAVITGTALMASSRVEEAVLLKK